MCSKSWLNFWSWGILYSADYVKPMLKVNKWYKFSFLFDILNFYLLYEGYLLEIRVTQRRAEADNSCKFNSNILLVKVLKSPAPQKKEKNMKKSPPNFVDEVPFNRVFQSYCIKELTDLIIKFIISPRHLLYTIDHLWCPNALILTKSYLNKNLEQSGL